MGLGGNGGRYADGLPCHSGKAGGADCILITGRIPIYNIASQYWKKGWKNGKKNG